VNVDVQGVPPLISGRLARLLKRFTYALQ